MITVNLIAQLSVVILPILIYVVWKFGYKRSVLNYHREVLFEERFKLYKLAFEKKIETDRGSYRELEKFINSNIRYAHRMTGLSISYVLMFFKKENKEQFIALSKIDSELDDELIAKLNQIKRNINKQILWFVKRYSPLFHLVSYVLLIQHIIKSISFNSKKISRKKKHLDLNLVNTDLEFEEQTYDYQTREKSEGALQLQ